MTSAAHLTQGDSVLWFDSSTSKLAPHRVIEIHQRCLGGPVSLILSRSGKKIRWTGPADSEIRTPPKRRGK